MVNKKIPFWAYLLLVITSYFLFFCNLIRSRAKFYFYSIFTLASLSVWFFALYALAVLHFSKTSEGNFASIDRYVLILMGGYIIFSLSLLAYVVKNAKNLYINIFSFLIILILIINIKSDNIILTSREIHSGAKEFQSVRECIYQNREKIRSSKFICMISAEGDFLHKVRLKYEILPKAILKEYLAPQSVLDLQKEGCNLVITLVEDGENCILRNDLGLQILEISK
jgi:hypothetical protein